MRNDFRLGDWIVRPHRGHIERGGEIVQIHPKAMAVLECLAAAGGEVVKRDELFDAVWPGVIVTDDALAHCVMELRKAFGDSARDAEIIRTIPKVGFCLIPSVTDATEERPVAGSRMRFPIFGIPVVAVLVLGAVVAWWTIGDSERGKADTAGARPAAAPNSIAVLPFRDINPGQNQAYFADGISEELINLLAQIPELRVISRSSSFTFKGKDLVVPEVAKQLNVAYILEGTVRKARNRIRITAQLIEARSDTHLWSESYDRELDDIFAVQDEIAAAIGEALRMRLVLGAGEAAPPTTIRTVNTDAYDAYLRGHELIQLRGQQNMKDSIRYLEHALRLDEGFAPAHAQLAIATTHLILYGEPIGEEAMLSAISHLDRAQALEPDLAEAHAGQALLAAATGNVASQLEHAQKALESRPNYSDAMILSVDALESLGRYEEANATIKQLLVTDPLSVIGRIRYGVMLSSNGKTTEAHELADQLFAQSPWAAYRLHALVSLEFEGALAESLAWALKIQEGNFRALFVFSWVGEYAEARRIAHRWTFWADCSEGRWDEAVRATQKALQLNPNLKSAIEDAAEVLYHAGRLEEALPLYERLLELTPEGRPISGRLERTMRLAQSRRKTGDEGGAQTAAQIARLDHAARSAVGAANQFQDLTEAMLAAFDRDPDRVIAALKSAIQRGLRAKLLIDDPIFEESRDDPRFVALQQELETILAAEHEEVLQLICFNNPAPGIWQPMLQTCEGVEKQRQP